jgi:hypothetical protein
VPPVRRAAPGPSGSRGKRRNSPLSRAGGGAGRRSLRQFPAGGLPVVSPRNGICHVRLVRAGQEQARLAAAGAGHPGARGRALALAEMWIEDPAASASSWSRFLSATFSAVIRDRHHRRDDDRYAA